MTKNISLKQFRHLSALVPFSFLSQTGLLSGDVAPLLDDGLLDRLGVSSGPGAHLLGHVHTLLGGRELRNQSGDVFAGSLWLQSTFLLRSILDHSLHFIVALLRSLLQDAASGGTELPGLLGTSGDGGVLLHLLLGDGAHLPWPLGALGVGGVARGLVLTLLFDLGGALNNVVLNVVLVETRLALQAARFSRKIPEHDFRYLQLQGDPSGG